MCFDFNKIIGFLNKLTVTKSLSEIDRDIVKMRWGEI